MTSGLCPTWKLVRGGIPQESVGICPVLYLYQCLEEEDVVHLPQICIWHQAGVPVVKYLMAGLHDLDGWEEGVGSDPVKFNKDKCWGLLWKAECCSAAGWVWGTLGEQPGSRLKGCQLCSTWEPCIIPSSLCSDHCRNNALNMGKTLTDWWELREGHQDGGAGALSTESL